MKRGWQNQGLGVRMFWDEHLSVLVKWFVITSIISVLCGAVTIITRKILSLVPELSNCPGAFRLLYFKERISQLRGQIIAFFTCSCGQWRWEEVINIWTPFESHFYGKDIRRDPSYT